METSTNIILNYLRMSRERFVDSVFVFDSNFTLLIPRVGTKFLLHFVREVVI